ncbi:MAG TPA: hydrogenase formation protein HypD, partial [Terriglobales bacterium]
RVQGFIAPGHVCTITGTRDYEDIVREFRIPIVIAGFEPLDILQGVLMCVTQLEQGRAEVENQYKRAVRREGNLEAQRLIHEVFQVTGRKWRGIGEIPESGLSLRPEYASFDAELKFGLSHYDSEECSECISGLVMQGRAKPADCSAFGTACTPEKPLGAPMVSGEGACAAYYRYRSRDPQRSAT